MTGEPAADVAVKADGVSKTFRLPKQQVHTLKERVLHPTARQLHDPLLALRDVGFEVARGEFFGIVGRNGSGKSTLMKCLAGIYQADAGEMWLRGRMSPFIELGVGFNPELTAHDNVLINAVMLGLDPAQARSRYSSILDFAELHEFADMKLKNYSSGMQVRLAFSVMVHVDADVLLIDEVLAVGDAAFQAKCHDALLRAREEGRTILLVTHDMTQVERFCDRALLLDRGRVVALGPAKQVARRYTQLNFSSEAEREAIVQTAMHPAAEEPVEVVDAWAQNLEGRQLELRQGEPSGVAMRLRFRTAVQRPTFTFVISNDHAQRVLVLSTRGDAGHAAGEQLDVTARFDNHLARGRYWLSVQITDGDRVLALREDHYAFAVDGPGGQGLVSTPHEFHVSPAPTEVSA